MGFPISSYHIINAIGSGDHWGNFARQILREFRIVAFVLHHPEWDQEISEYLEDEFFYLDRMTGRHLAFLALVNPGGAWRRNLGRHDPRHKFQQWDESNIWNPRCAPVSNNIDATLASAACSLGVPERDLPVIVFTDSLDENYFYYLCVNKHNIDFIFKRLARGAEFGRSATDLFRDFIPRHELTRYAHSKRMELTDSLVSTLFETLGFLKPGHGFNNTGQDSEYMLHALRRLQSKVNGIRDQIRRETDHPGMREDDHSRRELNEDLERAVRRVLLAVGQQGHQSSRGNYYEYLDRSSRTIYDSILTIKERHHNNQGADSETMIDPRFIGFGYGMIFENEINQSLVNFFRNHLGVPMPEYFSKYYPAQANMNFLHTPVFHDHATGQDRYGDPIDLNAERRGELKMPSLGSSRLIAHDYRRNNHIPNTFWHPQFHSDAFLNAWSQICHLRNRADHPLPFNEDDLASMERHFANLHRYEYFQKMSQMRKGLRGDDGEYQDRRRRQTDYQRDLMIRFRAP